MATLEASATAKPSILDFLENQLEGKSQSYVKEVSLKRRKTMNTRQWQQHSTRGANRMAMDEMEEAAQIEISDGAAETWGKISALCSELGFLETVHTIYYVQQPTLESLTVLFCWKQHLLWLSLGNSQARFFCGSFWALIHALRLVGSEYLEELSQHLDGSKNATR